MAALNDFDYISPTRIIFGKSKELEIANVLNEYKVKKVLIHYGKNSVIKSGLLDKIKNQLNKSNIEFIELGGVRANPTLSLVKMGIEIIRKNPVELILAVGGGSVIDSAKLIAQGFYYHGDPYDFVISKEKPKQSLPVGVILTIAAAGSEMSSSCVISHDELKVKRGFNSPFNRPLFAIMNPELTFSVDKFQTACGIVDIMMHTLERYFNESTENELADELAEGLLKSVMTAGIKVYFNPNDYESRATLMLASSLSHNGLTSLGKKSYMPVHQLEHALSGEYDFVAHGAGLAMLFPVWADYYLHYDTKKFAKFARNVIGVEDKKDLSAAKEGIHVLREYFVGIGMPMNYNDLYIKNVDIEKLVDVVSANKTKAIPHHRKELDFKVADKIFRACIKE